MEIKSFSSLQTLQYTPPLHDVFVVPLNVPRFFEPAIQVSRVDLIRCGVTRFGCLELALVLQTRLLKGLSAPKKESNASFQLAVAYDRVAIEKPDGVGVPDFAFRFAQYQINLSGKCFANGFVVGVLLLVVGLNVLMHGVVIVLC